MSKERLKKALELIKQEYAEHSDPEDPYTGGVLSNKAKRRYKRLIDTLQSMVHGNARLR